MTYYSYVIAPEFKTAKVVVLLRTTIAVLTSLSKSLLSIVIALAGSFRLSSSKLMIIALSRAAYLASSVARRAASRAVVGT